MRRGEVEHSASRFLLAVLPCPVVKSFLHTNTLPASLFLLILSQPLPTLNSIFPTLARPFPGLVFYFFTGAHRLQLDFFSFHPSVVAQISFVACFTQPP